VFICALPGKAILEYPIGAMSNPIYYPHYPLLFLHSLPFAPSLSPKIQLEVVRNALSYPLGSEVKLELQMYYITQLSKCILC